LYRLSYGVYTISGRILSLTYYTLLAIAKAVATSCCVYGRSGGCDNFIHGYTLIGNIT